MKKSPLHQVAAVGGGQVVQSIEVAGDGGDVSIKVRLTAYIRQEDGVYVVRCPMLGVSTYGKTIDEAKENIADATRGFLQTCYEMGTLNDVLLECGFKCHSRQQRATRKKRVRKIAGDWEERFRFPAQFPLAAGC